jgi:serine/threonine protein kinase
MEGRRLSSGRYVLGELLGGGGTADVFRATDTTLGRPVAIKLFRAGTEVANQQRFEREARLLAPLSHPGLVMIYDAGVEDASVFLVLQLIDGVTLRQLLGAGTVPTHAVVRLGARLASVLAYVHGQGIVHRDMKPSNVLLDGVQLAPDASNVYLADFGISRLVDTSHLTATGMVVGTAAYMAPEQVMGRTVGPPADVYSLGLVLLESLTGEQEYSGAGAEAAVARLSRPPRIPANLPEPLRSVLADMTQNEPTLRPSAGTVAARLSGHPGPPGPATGTAVMGGAPVPTSGTRVMPGAAIPGATAGVASPTMPLPALGGGAQPPRGPKPAPAGDGSSKWPKALAIGALLLVVLVGSAFAASKLLPDGNRGGSGVTPGVTQSPSFEQPSPVASSEPSQAATSGFSPAPTTAPTRSTPPSPTRQPSSPPPSSAPSSPVAQPNPSESPAQGLPIPVPSISNAPARIADGRPNG